MDAIRSSFGRGRWDRLAFSVLVSEVRESEVPLPGGPLRRTERIRPFRLMCRTMRKRGSEGEMLGRGH